MTMHSYGSTVARAKARGELTAHNIRPNTWIVIGGELGHGVTVDDDGKYTCDCRTTNAVDGMCSHILAVHLAIHGDFVNPEGRRYEKYVEGRIKINEAKRGGNSSAAEELRGDK